MPGERHCRGSVESLNRTLHRRHFLSTISAVCTLDSQSCPYGTPVPSLPQNLMFCALLPKFPSCPLHASQHRAITYFARSHHHTLQRTDHNCTATMPRLTRSQARAAAAAPSVAPEAPLSPRSGTYLSPAINSCPSGHSAGRACRSTAT